LLDKFGYHLPLYRQHQRSAQAGITLSRATLTSWGHRTAELLEPIYHALLSSILQSEVGARYAGIAQSLIASCRLQGVDPYVYFVDVLQRIDTHPAFEVHLLTPRLWKQHFAANPLCSDLNRLGQ